MVILHIASISNNKASGMSVVIPKHVEYQSKYEQVALLNLNNNSILNGEKIRLFKLNDLENYRIKSLPKPFNNPELVIIHGIYNYKYKNITKDLIKLDIPYIIVPHGMLTKTAQRQKKIKKILANNIIFNKILKQANAIHYLSNNEKNNSISRKCKYMVVGNGVELKKYNTNLYKDKSTSIVYIGRLDIIIKGLDKLILGCNLYKEKIREKNITIKLFGTDINNSSAKLNNMVERLGIDDIIAIKGPVFDKEKEEVLLNSDIFIQTSKSEGQPLGVLEAMSYGLPVIITPGTGLAEKVINKGLGWVCDYNEDDIGRVIVKAGVNKEDMKEYSINSYNFIKYESSWESIAKETLKRYKGLLNYYV